MWREKKAKGASSVFDPRTLCTQLDNMGPWQRTDLANDDCGEGPPPPEGGGGSVFILQNQLMQSPKALFLHVESPSSLIHSGTVYGK